MEDALGGIGEHGAQALELAATGEQRGADLLVAAVDGRAADARAAHAADEVAELVRLVAPLEQPVGVGGQELRQRHEPGGVAGGGGVEDEVVVFGPSNQVGDALEQRRLVHAGGVARHFQVPVHFAVEALRHHRAHGAADGAQVLLRDGGRVELDGVEAWLEGDGGVVKRLAPDVAEVVGGVGGDEQDAATARGEADGGGGGDGGFAHAAFAADEPDWCV